MAKRLIVVLVVVLVFVGVFGYGYSHYRDRRTDMGEVVDESGTVTGSGGSAPVKVATRSETAESANESAPAQTATRATYTSVSPAATPVQSGGSTAPATDTIAPNPPNGTVFAGTGKFQVYRQGDLTWRLDTGSGKTCILFATEEQWRKPVVYRNGCGKG